MPRVFTSTVAGAPVGEVWALLRDFAAIGSWHPAVPACEIEGGPADRVGARSWAEGARATVRPVRPLHGCRGGHTRDRWGKVTRPGAVPRAS
jgi:Polyketide cyclase / dehydrase and lipid transport